MTAGNAVREKRLKRKNAFINKMILYFQTFSVFCSFTLIYYNHFRNQPWSVIRIFGLIIAIVGYILWCMARFEIGESFAYLPQHESSIKLIKTGVYSIFSHPIYIFSSLSLFGYILFIVRPMFLLIFIVLIPVQVYRAKKEKAALKKIHGEEYDDYLDNVLV